MYIVHVYVEVKPEQTEAFKEATLENAQESLKEPGVARFDILQDRYDPARFLLVEVYRTKEDTARHKDSRHYQFWRDAVMGMMAAPRAKQIYENVYPTDEEWEVA
ncbi:MAG: putative quinol monooxygenase [Chloroflexota bacterium]|nr:putative quinol monooxygenase [Chloroflexota bacterium]